MGEAVEPFRLEPVCLKTIWAGNRLSDIRNLEPGIGICREVCAYKGSENTIASGPMQGMKINEAIAAHHEELMGKDPSDQLIRAAYMAPVDDLSLQVHPNAEQAGNDYEKSESWYILEADPGAYICAGTDIQDKEVLRQAAQEDRLDKLVNKIPVQAGDFALIPAGLLHACGKNMLAVEIGSFGGITRRLGDYGRGRPLHIEEGMDILDPSLQPSFTHHPLKDRTENVVSTGVDHPLFHVDVLDVADAMERNTQGLYRILICVDGKGKVYHNGKEYPLGYTETPFVPAGAGAYTLAGNMRILEGYHPL